MGASPEPSCITKRDNLSSVSASLCKTEKNVVSFMFAKSNEIKNAMDFNGAAPLSKIKEDAIIIQRTTMTFDGDEVEKSMRAPLREKMLTLQSYIDRL